MRTATIIGGGIGGAAAAIALTRAGWPVEVHERAEMRETSGAALGLWPTAMTALDALGVGDQIRAAATAQGAGSLRRADGRRIATVDARRIAGAPVLLIPRRDLATILVGALPTNTIHYGAGRRHEEVGGDVVIAADGAFSATRAALFGPNRIRYCGQTAFRGRIALATDTVSETWGAGARFGITPYRDNTTNWYASVSRPARERPPDGELALLRRTFDGWPDPIPRVLAALTETDIMRHDLYRVDPPLPSYVVGNTVLIGDAAHAMTPDLGRGACEALIDAVALARHLTTSADVGPALARFDRERRGPTQRLVRLSYQMGRLAHARHLTAVRDVALRAASALPVPGSRQK
jgi:2-polyprenyl-6-methoxyphenol hydroxylase-like FAD-dependent oxidoreductase